MVLDHGLPPLVEFEPIFWHQQFDQPTKELRKHQPPCICMSLTVNHPYYNNIYDHQHVTIQTSELEKNPA